MSGPQVAGRAYWLVLFFVPATIWLAVFVGLDGIGGFKGFMRSLAGACEGALSFLPACGDLDTPQRSMTKVPRDFLAASHVVILGATAIALALAVLMAGLTPLGGREKPRERWMFWATVAGIVAVLLLFLPRPALRIPSASAVSLMFCLLGGVAALLVYIKLSELRTAGRRGTKPPDMKPPPGSPTGAPPVLRR